MATNLCPPTSDELRSDALWATLYFLLFPLVKRWVFSSKVCSWSGQKYDITCDIVQEAIKRTLEYQLKAKSKGIAIISLEHLSVTIAKNYYRDLLRKEYRLVHFDQDDSLPGYQASLHNLVDPSEIAFDMVYTDWLFTQIADAVAAFPPGTRTALLIDLASRMHFDDAEPTSLQRAFLEVGIRLQDFEHLLPKDPEAKSRHASLVSVAYRRLRKVICRGQYDSAA